MFTSRSHLARVEIYAIFIHTNTHKSGGGGTLKDSSSNSPEIYHLKMTINCERIKIKAIENAIF